MEPGILAYEAAGTEVFVAIDEGILVKAGPGVLVSVRNAVGGASLGRLREVVEQEFLKIDEQEKSRRMVLAKLENGFVRRFMELRRE